MVREGLSWRSDRNHQLPMAHFFQTAVFILVTEINHNYRFFFFFAFPLRNKHCLVLTYDAFYLKSAWNVSCDSLFFPIVTYWIRSLKYYRNLCRQKIIFVVKQNWREGLNVTRKPLFHCFYDLRIQLSQIHPPSGSLMKCLLWRRHVSVNAFSNEHNYRKWLTFWSDIHRGSKLHWKWMILSVVCHKQWKGLLRNEWMMRMRLSKSEEGQWKEWIESEMESETFFCCCIL